MSAQTNPDAPDGALTLFTPPLLPDWRTDDRWLLNLERGEQEEVYRIGADRIQEMPASGGIFPPQNEMLDRVSGQAA